MIDRGSVINIRMFTHHIKCRMNRKAPGTTRSSLPTLHRRRNTTIPGISSSGSWFGSFYFPFNRTQSTDQRGAQSPAFVLESPSNANLNFTPGSLWKSTRTPVASSRSSPTRVSVTQFRQTADLLHPPREQTLSKTV